MKRPEKLTLPAFKLTWRSGFWLPVIAAAMVMLALIPGESVPDETVGQSREIATSSATFACPVQEGSEVIAGQIEAGESAEARSLPQGDVDESWAQADQWRVGKPAAGAFVVSQTGEASGALGYVAGKARGGLGGGQLFSRCPDLLDEGWFVGLADRGKSVIQLANLSDSIAAVDVYWWSTIGPVEGDKTMGLAIGPGETTTIAIGDHVPVEDVVAAQVVRRRQQVSAVALSAGKSGEGTEFLLPQSSLSRNTMLAGLPSKGSISVALLNPHDETVRVTLQGIRAGGTFDIEGLDDIAVKPESTMKVDVPASAELNGHAIQVVAERAIAATAEVVTAKDMALISPAERLRRPSAVPVSLAGQDVSLTLVAPQESAAVTIEGVDEQMNVVATKNISVPAGTSMIVDLAKDLKGAVAAVVQADGVAFGGAWTRKGDLIASTPVLTAPVSIRVPAVVVR